MPRDSHESSRDRTRHQSSPRREERYRPKSTTDGKINYRERSGNMRGRNAGDERQGSRSYRPNNRRSRSRSPPAQKPKSDQQTANLEKYKTSGLLNAMNPVGGESSDSKPENKLKPDFGLSGKLAEDTNKFNGVVVKYNEPPEAKKPSRKWRLYPFKGEESLEHIEIHKQSAFLLGRDRKVADIPIDHPSCSSQHAVIQFRAITFEREDGSSGKKVRPYLIDLESSNGTFLNNKQIDPRKYYEIFDKDCIKFGFSSREYVLMHLEYQEEDE